MATNSCLKYPFCVEWTVKIPYGSMPISCPNIILLEGVECHLVLTRLEEQFRLYIALKQGERSKVLNKFTVSTFLRDSSYGEPKLIAYRQLCNNNETLWINIYSAILAEIPNIFIIGKMTFVCVFHSTDTHVDKKHSAHVSIQTTLSSVASVNLQSLSLDFSTFLKDETFSDVKLICADRTFSANRSILAARSEVFAAMFRNKMAETETGEVDIKDTDPEMLELLLKYVYSAEIPDLPDLCEEIVHRLYEAADKYAVHGLKRACSDCMLEGQTTDNCLDLLLFAEKHSDENLKEAVTYFVAEYLSDLSVESWSTFSDEYPLLAFAVLKKRCEDSIPGAAKGAK